MGEGEAQAWGKAVGAKACSAGEARHEGGEVEAHACGKAAGANACSAGEARHEAGEEEAPKEQAEKVEEEMPERILPSRCAMRRKPVDKAEADSNMDLVLPQSTYGQKQLYIAKARWIIILIPRSGHPDPGDHKPSAHDGNHQHFHQREPSRPPRSGALAIVRALAESTHERVCLSTS